MQIDRLLDGMDLSKLHTFLTITGMLLAVYVMQLTSYANEDAQDHWSLRWGRRASLAAVALALLWSLSYSATKSWQPWPPEVALIMALIGILSFRAAAIHSSIKRRYPGGVPPRRHLIEISHFRRHSHHHH